MKVDKMVQHKNVGRDMASVNADVGVRVKPGPLRGGHRTNPEYEIFAIQNSLSVSASVSI
jgi:hypothetical protein